jgi:hypothetical protein
VDSIHLTQEIQVLGSCEHGNEPSGSTKYGVFIYLASQEELKYMKLR